MRALVMTVHTITLRSSRFAIATRPTYRPETCQRRGVSEGILRPALSVAVSGHAETYRRTWRRSRSGSDRWVRFTPCLHGQVSWSHGGVVLCDAGEMRSRPWAGGRLGRGDDGGRMRPEHCHCRLSLGRCWWMSSTSGRKGVMKSRNEERNGGKLTMRCQKMERNLQNWREVFRSRWPELNLYPEAPSHQRSRCGDIPARHLVILGSGVVEVAPHLRISR